MLCYVMPVDEPEPMSVGSLEQAPVTQVTQVTQVDAGDAGDAGDAEDSDAPVARRTKRTGKSFQATNSETSGRERDNRWWLTPTVKEGSDLIWLRAH